MTIRTLSRVAAAVWLVALFILTLTPQPTLAAARQDLAQLSVCLICGSRGTSDALLNLVLFAPLFLVIPRRHRTFLMVTLVGLALSVGVETVQHFIPGRYSNVGDVVWNTTGAALGRWLWATRRRWTRPDAVTSVLLTRWAAAGAVLATLAFGLLMVPSWSRDRYWGQWTPQLGTLAQYQGQVVDARLGDLALPPTRFPADADPRAVLLGAWCLDAMVVKGPPPPSLAPVVSIFDGQQRDVLMLAAVGEDLVYIEHERAALLRLDQPEIRFEGALEGFAPGDTLNIAVTRDGHRRCVTVGGYAACHTGYPAARAWALLLYHHVPRGTRGALDVLWLFALFFPLGFWAYSWRSALGWGAATAAAMVAAALLTGLVAGSGVALATVPVSLWAGQRIRRHLERRVPGPGSPGPV